MKTVPCRYCGEAIGFVATPRGRQMPVDPELETFHIVPAARGEPSIRIVLENGNVIAGKQVAANEPNTTQVRGYLPHWDSCTDEGRNARRG